MISGFFSKGKHNSKSFVAIACFSECVEFGASDAGASIQWKMLYSEETSIGVFAGSNNDKFIFLSHLVCVGADCGCHTFAKQFLEEPSSEDEEDHWSSKLESLKLDLLSAPFMLLLGNNTHCSCISGFSGRDIAESAFPPPEEDGTVTCNFLDCQLKLPNASSVLMKAHVQDWLRDDSLDSQKVASDLTDCLYPSLQGWPKPTGTGLVLLCYDGELVIASVPRDPQHFLPPQERASKPRHPSTPFNLFAKEMRKSVEEEHNKQRGGDGELHTLSNNEVNKLVGQLWHSMSVEEKLPYYHRAELDRTRYFEEWAAQVRSRHQQHQLPSVPPQPSNATEDVTFATLTSVLRVGVPEGETAGQHVETVTTDPEEQLPLDAALTKPLTAYNQFLHQEKSFVMGLQLENAKSRTGKHGSVRWTSMHPEESLLYEAIRIAEIDDM